MMVYTKLPRIKTFTRFFDAKDCARFIAKNQHRFIACRAGLLGSFVVNHYKR